MNQDAFEAFKVIAISGHADDLRVSRGLPADKAFETSTAEFNRLAPLGLKTPGHYFFSIRPEGERESVGHLWFAMIEQDSQWVGYIYELRVDAASRRRGYAAEAMRAVEAKARSLGLARLRLHTFGHNLAAQALYLKLGFEPIGIVMQRSLDVTHSKT